METWVFFTIIATIMNILWFITFKYLTHNDDSFIIIMYAFVITGFLSLLSLMYLHYFSEMSIKPNNIYGIILLAFIVFAANILLSYAVLYANNPSYVRAFVALEIALLAIIFSYYHKESLNIGKMVGILSVIFGIILLSFS